MNLLPSTPQDRRRMDRHARTLSRSCGACGGTFHRANLLPMRDGRSLCPDCATAALEVAWARAERELEGRVS